MTFLTFQTFFHRFYPGLGSPATTLPAIDGGISPAGVIDSPAFSRSARADTHSEPPKLNPKPGTPKDVSSNSRATRVVGSFDHPILPMPPVNITFFHSLNSDSPCMMRDDTLLMCLFLYVYVSVLRSERPCSRPWTSFRVMPLLSMKLTQVEVVS